MILADIGVDKLRERLADRLGAFRVERAGFAFRNIQEGFVKSYVFLSGGLGVLGGRDGNDGRRGGKTEQGGSKAEINYSPVFR